MFVADAQGHGAAESVASKKTHSERRHLKAPRKELMFLNVPSQHRETTRVTQSTGFGKIRPDGHRAAASTAVTAALENQRISFSRANSPPDLREDNRWEQRGDVRSWELVERFRNVSETKRSI